MMNLYTRRIWANRIGVEMIVARVEREVRRRAGG